MGLFDKVFSGTLDFMTLGQGDKLMEGLTGEKSTANAIAAQQSATREANALQERMFNTQRKDLEPWRDVGGDAIKQLGRENQELSRAFTMADFQKDPGYQFRLDEGMKGIQGSAAASGSLFSGNTLKSLNRYGQDYASNEYSKVYDRFNNDQAKRFNNLASLAGIGQTSANQTANAAGAYGQQVGQNLTNMGNAQASAYVGNANRMSNLIGQGIGAGAMAFSDERLKTNIAPISQDDLKELRETIKPYMFNYIDDRFGEGDWVGVMAQDLEKSKLGRRIVEHDDHGNKMINLNKFASLVLATLAEA